MSNSQKSQAELDNIFIKRLNRQEVHKEEKDIDTELSSCADLTSWTLAISFLRGFIVRT